MTKQTAQHHKHRVAAHDSAELATQFVERTQAFFETAMALEISNTIAASPRQRLALMHNANTLEAWYGTATIMAKGATSNAAKTRASKPVLGISAETAASRYADRAAHFAECTEWAFGRAEEAMHTARKLARDIYEQSRRTIT